MREMLEQWSDFNVAVAGATAALAGLLIVAMSVNIERILAARGASSQKTTMIRWATVAKVSLVCHSL